jgi:VWFA-related protein
MSPAPLRLQLPPLRLIASLMLTGLLGVPNSTLAQQPATQEDHAKQPPMTTLSVDARLVNLPVVVRDKKGALIQNLTKDSFVLTVDGHAQTIRYFDHDANLPLTLGLLVDTSQSQRGVLDEERTASTAFLEQMMTTPPNREPDKAFVIQFAHTVELLQDLTASRPKLQAALKALDSSSPSSPPPDDPDSNQGRGRGSRGGGTTLYDATFLAADELMSKQKGRKALILLTDGVDNGSKESLTKSIEAAQRADTIIYAIYFKGEEGHDQGDHRGGGGGRGPGGGGGGIGFPGGGRFPGGGGGNGGGNGGGGGGPRGGGGGNRADGKKTLERMANETGGRMFEVSKKQTTAQIYTQIAEELRAQYRLGYTPDQATASDGYHQIDLTLRDSDQQKKLTVQTRDGYYTGK